MKLSQFLYVLRFPDQCLKSVDFIRSHESLGLQLRNLKWATSKNFRLCIFSLCNYKFTKLFHCLCSKSPIFFREVVDWCRLPIFQIMHSIMDLLSCIPFHSLKLYYNIDISIGMDYSSPQFPWRVQKIIFSRSSIKRPSKNMPSYSKSWAWIPTTAWLGLRWTDGRDDHVVSDKWGPTLGITTGGVVFLENDGNGLKPYYNFD